MIKNKLRIVIFLILAYSFSTLPIYSEELIYVGEELEYDVTFMSIKLGRIKIVTLENDEYQGIKTYHSKVFMESNPNIPFLSMKAIFNSWMDKSLSTGVYFEGSTKLGRDGWGYQKIIFNKPQTNSLTTEKYYDKEKINDTILTANMPILDGATLFFFARQNVNMNKKVKVQTIMDLSIGNTFLNFTGKTEKVKIKAVDYPISTYYLNGKAEWVGVYGLGDKFEGWFSSDYARIPIKANMNVYIGSIVLELKKWKRGDWQPPR